MLWRALERLLSSASFSEESEAEDKPSAAAKELRAGKSKLPPARALLSGRRLGTARAQSAVAAVQGGRNGRPGFTTSSLPPLPSCRTCSPQNDEKQEKGGI